MTKTAFGFLVSARGERAALGWAAVMLVAPLACLGALTGCAETVQPAASESSEEAQPEGPEPGSDPAAIEVARRTLEAMGGWQAYERTRYLRFGFVVERGDSRDEYQHVWDRWTSSYRVEGDRTIDDREVAGLVLLNLEDRTGSAYIRGADGGWVAVDADDTAAWLDWGHARFTNDTYWLLMPYKLQDRGVILEMADPETVDGVEYDVLHLSFDNVGRTPGDQYWVFINPRTSLVERWGYVLQGTEPPRTEWVWTDWASYGPLTLSRTKVLQDPEESMRIVFEPLAALESVDAAVFSNPAVAMPGQ